MQLRFGVKDTIDLKGLQTSGGNQAFTICILCETLPTPRSKDS
ncbi:hypothetical protein PDIG_86130 [Penicillium digitatum PHI26]|uniref:Uncharacterized protein n=2 Tax=Penicillium digitatum TaxID=36651 RepID=K9F795_PEND2|nr:hypothetical protein PDIP_46940 [Penicillium digitatum Pd1]EKV04949.1 hypothetical protein PDIG_86130 [Penicillium digitatum PHI26]EKV13786.1 hypothetical protein PDIP_46940 [Penicillium digitatum Pd1]